MDYQSKGTAANDNTKGQINMGIGIFF